MPQRRFSRHIARHRRHVHIAQRLLLVTHVALLLQHSQFGAHRRVSRRVGQRLMNFRSRRASLLVENVHDLPFAPAEIAMSVFPHKHMLQKKQLGAKIALHPAPVKGEYNEI